MRLRLAAWVCALTLAVSCSVQGEIVPVYFVGTNSQAPAQMALDMVYGSYPPGTSVTNYPPPVDPTKAESVVAGALRLNLTNDLSALVNLYNPGERSQITPPLYAGRHRMFSNAVDFTLDRFYWLGDQEWISYRFRYNGAPGVLGKDPHWGTKLIYTNGLFYLSDVLDPVSQLFQRYVSDAIHGVTAPLAPSYRYTFRYPPSGGRHPLRVLFNGTAMKLRIDTNTVASDELEAFMTNVVATYRSGNLDSAAALWNAREGDRLRNPVMADATLLSQNLSRFNVPNVYLIFKLDFGPKAALYYQTTDADDNPIGSDNGVYLMTLYKDANGHPLLTEVDIKQPTLFDGNVRTFLSSPEFMDFIFQQIPRQTPPARN
jgi:hypothetical protein